MKSLFKILEEKSGRISHYWIYFSMSKYLYLLWKTIITPAISFMLQIMVGFYNGVNMPISVARVDGALWGFLARCP